MAANYKPNSMAQDYFAPEPDFNHPDQNKSFSAQAIEIGEDGALYVYVPRDNMPPAIFQRELDQVQEKFKEAFPNTTVIVGAHDLKFTAISRKQVFKSKLDGSLNE